MILFKGCPRCGGDVDTSFDEDIFCIQCSYRLPDAKADDRGGSINPSFLKQPTIYRPVKIKTNEQEVLSDNVAILCPRCDSDDISELGKLKSRDNTCYRCRRCGHIFSPKSEEAQDYPEAATT